MKKILSVILCLLLCLSLCACGGEKVAWSDMVLGEMLPEPPANKGEIHENSNEELWIDIYNISDKQFADYVNACKEKGFTVDAQSDSISYDAYNSEGYKLGISHYGNGEEMTIDLEIPMEMSTIIWPTSVAGSKIPAPKSSIGKFSYEYDDNFFVYVGNTTKTDYAEYVAACLNAGFNVDYSKGDDYYYADNSDGWHVDIRYIGNNIISIDIDAPSEDDSGNDVTTSPAAPPTQSTTDNNSIAPDFKAAMDSYEKFMDEYVAFMKKYSANPTDMSLLADYADYMSKYADFVDDFEDWDDEDMNAAEAAYYIEVQARVNKKLLEIAS